MTRALRVAVVAAIAAVSAALLFPVLLSLRADGNRVIEAQPMDYALLVVSTLLIASGAQVISWRRAFYPAFLGFLASAALLFGILGAFGVGLAILPVGILALVLLYRVLRRRPPSASRSAALGGALAGYGAILLLIALMIPPTVECFANGGGSTSSQRWDRSGGGYAVTSSGSSTVDGVQTGTIQSTNSVATYRCEQGRIVEFRRESR